MNFLQVINLKNSPSFTLILYAIYKKFQLSLVSRFWFVSHINSTFFDQKVYTTQKFFKMRGKELARKETERKTYYIAGHSQNLKPRTTSGNS